MAPRPPGSIVTLTDLEPRCGGGPEPGDVLETRTGRRYLIDRISPGSGRSRRLSCVVMAPDDPQPEGAVRFTWSWAPRPKARR